MGPSRRLVALSRPILAQAGPQYGNHLSPSARRKRPFRISSGWSAGVLSGGNQAPAWAASPFGRAVQSGKRHPLSEQLTPSRADQVKFLFRKNLRFPWIGHWVIVPMKSAARPRSK